MRSHTTKAAPATTQPAATQKGGGRLVDNRPGKSEYFGSTCVLNQRKAYNIPWLRMERSVSRKVSFNSPDTIQLVARTSSWSNQEAHFQPNIVHGPRKHGDAEWLAIVRYCKDVPIAIKNISTVNQVLQYARVNFKRNVSFDAWKGSQATNDSQEAQHLIPTALAAANGLTYRQINSPENGKMLLAGRGGTQLHPPVAYINAKLAAGKAANRGILHITHGQSHPTYNAMVQAYIQGQRNANNILPRQPLPHALFISITNHLRQLHKQYDQYPNVNPAGMGVDNLQPHLHHPLHLPAPLHHPQNNNGQVAHGALSMLAGGVAILGGLSVWVTNPVWAGLLGVAGAVGLGIGAYKLLRR